MSQTNEIMTFASSIMTAFYPTRETRSKGGADIRPRPLTASVLVRGAAREWGETTELAMTERGDDGDEDAIGVTTTNGVRTIEQLLQAFSPKGIRIRCYRHFYTVIYMSPHPNCNTFTASTFATL